MIKTLKYRDDINYYLFFDVETSPIYFYQNDKNIEESQKISFKQYNNYKTKNEKSKRIIHKIGSYQITKMISLIDEENNAKCFIVEDECLESDLDNLITDKFNCELYYGESSDEIIEMFWGVIDNYMQEYSNVRVFAHNIGFDSKQIKLFEKIKELEGKEINEDGKSNKITSGCVSKPFFIKIRYDEESILSFDDSYSFFSQSLKKLGKDIGIEKLEETFENEKLLIDDKMIEYCITDSYIIKEAICRFKNLLSDKELGFLGTTLASTAMNIWRTSFLEYKIDNEYNNKILEIEDIIKIERSCYFGGRNECYKIGNFNNIYYYDINSLYPYIMESFKFPVKFETIYDNQIEKFNDNYIIRLLSNPNYYYIFECTINTKSNHIPYRTDRLMFIKGEYKGWIHLPEFKYFFLKGEVKEVTRVLVYKQDYIFKDYIKFFKKMKIENDDNPTYRKVSKILQNALYGKTAEYKRDSKFFDNDEPQIERVEIANEKGDIIGHRDMFGFFGIQSFIKQDENAKTAFPAIAGAVTSYARMELVNMIDLLGIKNIIYCDTDSIMSYLPIPNKFLHDYKYGYWKNEAHKLNNKETLSVLIKGCKNYILHDNDKILSIKSKGIKKDSIEIDNDLYSTNKWWTVKTSKVKKETIFTLNHTVIMQEIKKNTLEYLKGKTIFKGTKKIKLDGINIKYNERDIYPWLASELEKLDKEE
jgi:hypothetical protein